MRFFIIGNSCFPLLLFIQIGVGRTYPCESMQMRPRHHGIDLVIVDAPEDLVVSVISPVSVPSWNKRETNYFDQLFAFADCHLTDDGVVLLFHPKNRRIEKKSDSKIKIYDFTIVRDWWGYNTIPMASSLPHQKEVLYFIFIIWIFQSDNPFLYLLILKVVLQTHNFNFKVFAHLSSKFCTRRLRLQFVQMDILPEEHDDLTNFTTTESQLLRPSGFPWRGSRGKDPSFVQCFIECLTDERDIVCDWSPSTCFQSLPLSFTTAFWISRSNFRFSNCRCFCHCLPTFETTPHRLGAGF